MKKLLLLLLLFSACKQKIVLLNSIKDCKLDFGTNQVRGIDHYTNDSVNYLTFLNNKAILFLNVTTNRIEDSIPLADLDSVQKIEKQMAFFVQNNDSIFVIPDFSKNEIFLLDHSGKVKRSWKVDKELANHNKQYSLVTTYKIPLYYQANRIYVMNSRTDVVTRTAEARKTYFTSMPDVTLNIEDSTISNTTGSWPAIYQSGLSYHDFWPARCVDSKQQLIYSFGINDSLYIYKDGNLKETVKARSRYFNDPIPYPDDSLDNFGFLRRYWITQSQYEQIIYDKYRNLYYRIVRHAGKYENEDGTVNDVADNPWSVIVLNDSFEILDEVSFDPKLYNAYLFAPTKEGILIAKQLTAHDGNYRSFTLFNLTIK